MRTDLTEKNQKAIKREGGGRDGGRNWSVASGEAVKTHIGHQTGEGLGDNLPHFKDEEGSRTQLQ